MIYLKLCHFTYSNSATKMQCFLKFQTGIIAIVKKEPFSPLNGEGVMEEKIPSVMDNNPNVTDKR